MWKVTRQVRYTTIDWSAETKGDRLGNETRHTFPCGRRNCNASFVCTFLLFSIEAPYCNMCDSAKGQAFKKPSRDVLIGCCWIGGRHCRPLRRPQWWPSQNMLYMMMQVSYCCNQLKTCLDPVPVPRHTPSQPLNQSNTPQQKICCSSDRVQLRGGRITNYIIIVALHLNQARRHAAYLGFAKAEL